MIPQVTNLFEFADYRKFLADYHAARQNVEQSFTRMRFCADVGLPNTRSFFSDIIAGRRPLSKTYVERVIRALRMDEEESQYFRVLVDFNQTGNDKERELLFEQLVSLNRTPRKFVQADQYAFYSTWYHTAVFSVLDVVRFRDDFVDLAKRVYPAITPKQARASINLLAKLGLIQRGVDGIWKAAERTLDTGRNVRDELVKQYQLQCLEMAKKVLLLGGDTPGARTFSTVTLSISKDAGALISKKLQKFKSEVSAIAHRDQAPADRVYQLNIQYFPQSNLEGLT